MRLLQRIKSWFSANAVSVKSLTDAKSEYVKTLEHSMKLNRDFYESNRDLFVPEIRNSSSVRIHGVEYSGEYM